MAEQELKFKVTATDAASKDVENITSKIKGMENELRQLKKESGETEGGLLKQLGQFAHGQHEKFNENHTRDLVHMLEGGGALLGVHFLGEAFAHVGESVEKISEGLRTGTMDSTQLTDTLMEGLPIIGGFWKAGEGFREAIYHTKQDAKELAEQMQKASEGIKEIRIADMRLAMVGHEGLSEQLIGARQKAITEQSASKQAMSDIVENDPEVKKARAKLAEAQNMQDAGLFGNAYSQKKIDISIANATQALNEARENAARTTPYTAESKKSEAAAKELAEAERKIHLELDRAIIDEDQKTADAELAIRVRAIKQQGDAVGAISAQIREKADQDIASTSRHFEDLMKSADAVADAEKKKKLAEDESRQLAAIQEKANNDIADAKARHDAEAISNQIKLKDDLARIDQDGVVEHLRKLQEGMTGEEKLRNNIGGQILEAQKKAINEHYYALEREATAKYEANLSEHPEDQDKLYAEYASSFHGSEAKRKQELDSASLDAARDEKDLRLQAADQEYSVQHEILDMQMQAAEQTHTLAGERLASEIRIKEQAQEYAKILSDPKLSTAQRMALQGQMQTTLAADIAAEQRKERGTGPSTAGFEMSDAHGLSGYMNPAALAQQPQDVTAANTAQANQLLAQMQQQLQPLQQLPQILQTIATFIGRTYGHNPADISQHTR